MKIEMTGLKFGKWKVLEYAGKSKGHGHSLWQSRCECGTLAILCGTDLRSGRSHSCKKCARRNNIYALKNGYGECTAVDGKKFKFDLKDYDFIKKFTWSINKYNYVKTHIDGREVSLHRLLLLPEPDEEIDHINRDPSDNRRGNLRLATSQENKFNKGLSKTNTSGYKGVYWHKERCKWRAMIKVDGKKIHLGLFINIEDAAESYNAAAIKYFGEFAWLNPVTRSSEKEIRIINTVAIGFLKFEESFLNREVCV